MLLVFSLVFAVLPDEEDDQTPTAARLASRLILGAAAALLAACSLGLA